MVQPPIDPEFADRFVKIRASAGDEPDTGNQSLTTGFVVGEGIVLTCAHGVEHAKRIVVSDLQDRRHIVSSMRIGHPQGPDIDKAPDFALLSVPEIGKGLRHYPIARLNRTVQRTLTGVHVFGFPYFKERRDGRGSFGDEGTVNLLSGVESGLIDIQLTTKPQAPTAGDDAPSQWAGLSGAPVIVDGHLVAVVTEHSPPVGTSHISATPLVLIDPNPTWPRWGPGVPDPDGWWDRLGVARAGQLPAVPDVLHVTWLEDLRALTEEMSEAGTPVPRRLCDPTRFATQANEVLVTAFGDLHSADFDRATQLLRHALKRPDQASDGSVYGIALREVLSVGRLSSALDDLLTVHAVADAQLPPPSLARLRYRISAPRIDVQDLDSEMDRWVSAHPDDEVLACELIDRLTITTLKDAHGELLACVSNAAWTNADPVRTAQALVTRLFSETSLVLQPAALEECFLGTTSSAAIVLTGADMEPSTIERDEDGFLVNEQPTLSHLRGGSFAPSMDLDAIEAAYWYWYQREVIGRGGRGSGGVPTYWLTGPSGAGKSVLLLQLAARLNSRAGVQVLLAAGAREGLGQVVAQALATSRTRHVIVGVDDPLTIRTGSLGWQSTFDSLSPVRQTESPTALPVFLCCAPTEQYGRFRQEFAGDVLIDQYVVNPYRPEFTDHLRKWYEERTGRPTQTSAPYGTPLPAQLFFEWWKGIGIGAFARRFRERIRATDMPQLAGFFDRLLAINRLYVGCPSAVVEALPPRIQDALAFLQHDMHVHKPTAERPGYWLSHPHLANIIYEEWFPEEGHHELRGAHLTAALVEAVQVDPQGIASLPLLEQLHADLGASLTRTSRTNTAQLRAALMTAAAEVGPGAHDLSHLALATWVRIAQRDPLSVAAWDPLITSVERLDSAQDDELGLEPLIRTLAELERPEADRAVWRFLSAHLGWAMWIPIASLVVARLPVETSMAALSTAVRAHLDDPQAIMLLATAMRRRPDDPKDQRAFTRASTDARDLAHQLVEGTLVANPAIAPVVAALFALRGRSRQTAVAWLDAEVRQENGVVFLEALTEAAQDPITWQALARWLVRFPLDEAADAGFARMLNSWQRVGDDTFRKALGKHLEQRGNKTAPELLVSLRRLLSSNHSFWSFLFTSLTPAQIGNAEIREAAIFWLENNLDSAAWSRVFGHLCYSVRIPDPNLYSRGMAQLQRIWDDPHSWSILDAMVPCCTEENYADLSDAMHRWLSDHKAEPEASRYLTANMIQRTPSENLEVVATAVFERWLEHRTEPWISYAIRPVLSAPVSRTMRQEVGAQVEEWLKESHLGWGHVFMDLVPLIGRSRAVDLARPWLVRDTADTRWGAVFATVVDDLSLTEISEIAYIWFGRPTKTDSMAGFVWKLILEDGPCRELLNDDGFRRVIHRWLRQHAHLRSWWHIWTEMRTSDVKDLESVKIALEVDLSLGRAHGVANVLRKTVIARPDLADDTWEVMAQSARGSAWQLSWLRLVSVAPSETAWHLGHSCLPALTPSHFSAWWRRLWNVYPERRSDLRPLARTWLASDPGEPGLKVRTKLDEDSARRITPATVFGRMRKDRGSA